MTRQWKPGDVAMVRRAQHGWRERKVVACEFCADAFVRLSNTRYCSDLCRLLDKVEVAGECWMWTATLDRHGYGTFYLGRNIGAHRASYLLHREGLPPGLHLDHLCGNRACVNPDHLEAVPQRVNTLRGNAPTAMAFRSGRCKAGHVRTPENTYVNPNDPRHRQCRICARAARLEREAS